MESSIIIGTHERKKYLQEVLESLKVLDYKGYEVIVIDSAKEPLDKTHQKLCNTYIHSPKDKALSIKRNIGLKKAKGDFVVYTDDDCEFSKDYLKEILKPLKNKEIMCVTGKTIAHKNYLKEGFEKYFSFNLGNKEKEINFNLFLNPWRIGHGNNMAYRKEIFNQVGLFDENLGVGAKGERSEDTDMFYRVLKKGYKIYYNPKAIIYHKHLIKKEQLPRMALLNGYGSYILLKKHFPGLHALIYYFGGIIKLSIKLIFSKSKFQRIIRYNTLKGWLGSKN